MSDEKHRPPVEVVAEPAVGGQPDGVEAWERDLLCQLEGNRAADPGGVGPWELSELLRLRAKYPDDGVKDDDG